MNGSLFDYIHKCWADFYYISPILNVCQLISLITIINHKKLKEIRPLFLLYIFASLLLFVGCDIIRYIHGKKDAFFMFSQEILNLLFLIIEYLAFSKFFHNVLKLRRKKLLFIFSSIVLTTLLIIYIYLASRKCMSFSEIRNYSVKISFLELTYFGILSLYYLYDLYKNMISENLLENPAFWLVSCSLFYFLVMPISLFLLESLRRKDFEMFRISVSVHYLSLCFVYIGISKAFLCKNPQMN